MAHPTVLRNGNTFQVKLLLTTGLAAILFVLGDATSTSAWLIYHKPAFKGKVIAAETKEPLEGAVVVAIYEKRAIRLAPHSVGIIMHAQETLTTKDGTFVIPSYTTITDPFSFDFEVNFIIYKPGYGRFPAYKESPSGISFPPGIKPYDHEAFFSKEIGSEGELELDWGTLTMEVRTGRYRVPFGIVELPRLKTREERLRAKPGSPAGFRSKELPLLYRALNEERRSLGLPGDLW
jgi:hypothetical protein